MYSMSAAAHHLTFNPRQATHPPTHPCPLHRDGDSEDRNFSPVLLSTGGGAQDLVITAMDQGWCFGYTCQKRLSTFWTYAPTGQVGCKGC
jgi:hypothetical protein